MSTTPEFRTVLIFIFFFIKKKAVQINTVNTCAKYMYAEDLAIGEVFCKNKRLWGLFGILRSRSDSKIQI